MRVYKKIFSLAGFLVFFLFLIEIELRGGEHVLGLFGSRRIQVSEANGYSVYCFGDSYTFGDGAMPKDSYPRQLEKLLNNNNDDKARIRFRVFNLGIPGMNSSQALLFMKHILAKYAKPDLIIIRVGVNDCWNFADTNFYLHLPLGHLVQGALRNLKLYTAIEDILFSEKNSYDWIPSKRDESNVIFKRMEFVKFKNIAEYNLSSMVKFAQARGIKIILQNYPNGDIYGPSTISNVARKHAVLFVDIFQAYNERLKVVKREDIFTPSWGYSHPNSEGYKIIAEEVYKAIIVDEAWF